MAIITTGNNFQATDAVTNTKLNNIANAATFVAGAVDGTSLELISGGTDDGKLGIKDNGVTLAKMATQADQTVLGNVSGGTAVPTAVPIVGTSGVLKNDDALGTSDTQGATQGNIKAYVDSNGITQTTGTAPYYGCRAFGSFNGKDSSPITPTDSGNVSSIVKNQAGEYTITLTGALPTNYSVVASAGHNIQNAYGNSVDVYNTSTTQIRIIVAQKTDGLYDPERVSFAVFG